MRSQTIFGALIAVAMLSVLLVERVINFGSPASTEPAIVLEELEYPTLTSKCFRYDGVEAENKCCEMYPYKFEEDVLQCVRKQNALMALSREESNSSDQALTSLTADLLTGRIDWALYDDPDPELVMDAVHWVLVGDSHLRYLFDVLIRRVSGVGLQYRMEGTKGWRPAEFFLKELRHHTIHEDIEVRHLALPFHITFYFDMFLSRLPALMRSWEENRHLAPTLVILDTGLHWIYRSQDLYKESGPETAMEKFVKHFHSLRPNLTRLASTTPTIFKLIDDIPKAHDVYFFSFGYNGENFAQLNHVCRLGLEGTGVIVWDSTLPLSIAYTKGCQKFPALTWKFNWKCYDMMHVGYILVEQYGNMILNYACNKYLNLQGDYCK